MYSAITGRFNRYLKTKTVPSPWKTSKSIILHKKGIGKIYPTTDRFRFCLHFTKYSLPACILESAPNWKKTSQSNRQASDGVLVL